MTFASPGVSFFAYARKLLGVLIIKNGLYLRPCQCYVIEHHIVHISFPESTIVYIIGIIRISRICAGWQIRTNGKIWRICQCDWCARCVCPGLNQCSIDIEIFFSRFECNHQMIPCSARIYFCSGIIAVIISSIRRRCICFKCVNGKEGQAGLGLEFPSIPAIQRNHITVVRIYCSTGCIQPGPKTY